MNKHAKDTWTVEFRYRNKTSNTEGAISIRIAHRVDNVSEHDQQWVRGGGLSHKIFNSKTAKQHKIKWRTDSVNIYRTASSDIDLATQSGVSCSSIGGVKASSWMISSLSELVERPTPWRITCTAGNNNKPDGKSERVRKLPSMALLWYSPNLLLFYVDYTNYGVRPFILAWQINPTVLTFCAICHFSQPCQLWLESFPLLCICWLPRDLRPIPVVPQ